MTEAGDGRIKQLDVIRFAAIVLVLFRHIEPCPPEVSRVAYAITSTLARGGWSGVDLFFVLSGFLVSGLIFREYKTTGGFDASRFLIRRGFKIYPAFWVLIAATFFYAQYRDADFSIEGFWGEILFIQNYYGHLWEHTWSLAVEEHFYLFLALVSFVAVRLSRNEPFRFVPKLFVFLAVACFLMRFYASLTYQFQFYEYFALSHLRFDSLFFGVAISYFWHFKNLGKNQLILKYYKQIAAAGPLLFLPFFIYGMEDTPWISSIGLTMGYVGAGCVLITLMSVDLPDNLLVNYAARVGKYSYSIYLWHFPVLVWGAKEFGLDPQRGWFLYSVFYLFFSILIGIVLSKLVEYPVLKLRNVLFPSRRQAV
jgi:peptidoglycan/LPS O-acetylase OafA/YrhL